MLSDTNESNVPQFLQDSNNDYSELSSYNSGYDPRSGEVGFRTAFNSVSGIGVHFLRPIPNYMDGSDLHIADENIPYNRPTNPSFIENPSGIERNNQTGMEKKGGILESCSYRDLRSIHNEYEGIDFGIGSARVNACEGSGEGRNSNGSGSSNGREGSTKSQQFHMVGDYKNLNMDCMKELTTNATTNSAHVFSEDLRISKMIRRLEVETNPTAAIELCEKLKTVIMDPSNAVYIRRAFNFLVGIIIKVFHQGPVECLEHVAKIFGMIGYVARNDYLLYKTCIGRNFESSKNNRIYLMQAFKETIKLDAAKLDLISYSERTLTTLKDWLEVADKLEHFIAVSDVIAEFAKSYKKPLEKHFNDIVDIVIGWHLETEHSPKLKQHCSYVLEQFSELFIKKMDFTVGLLEQFLEDIHSNGIEPSKETATSSRISVGSFIDAFVLVMKCLATDRELIAFKLDKHLFEHAISVISDVACKTLTKTTSQETVQSINEFFVIVLSQGQNQVNYDVYEILEIIKIEVERLKEFDNAQTGSLLFLLVTYVNVLGANTPIELITFLLDPQRKGLADIKFTSNKKHFRLLIKLYHKILAIKNVLLLQEAYKFILMDTRTALECLKSFNSCETMEYSVKQAECVLNFYLSAIAVLANEKSSIIGFALSPSILQLLINELSVSKLELWSNYPVLHNSLITLLSAHCIRNCNFLATSDIFMTGVFSKLSLHDFNPTSKNFTLIMKFLCEILMDSSLLSERTSLLILDWINVLYEEGIQHANLLKDNTSFVNIGKCICLLSVHGPKSVTIRCVNCMQSILKYNEINVKALKSIAEACCIHMFSTSNEIREMYSHIFAKLPLDISLRQGYETTGLFKAKEMQLSDLQHWYMSSQTQGNLREKYFKHFIEKITITETEDSIESFINDIFPKCWTFQNGRAKEFYCAVRTDWNCLISWIQWEAAQFCVNNKLRTPLGKPQETFLKIEAIIKEYARVLALKGDSNVKDIKTLIVNQKNARILLGFIEYLEKAIYNSAEGTAFAIPAPEKPARTFFRVNTSTCNEWFSRIRTAINLIALHTMEPEMVIRNSEVMLQMLVASNRTSETIFEHILMSIVWALLKTGEAEALHGLYIWTKKVSGKRIPWIKYAAEHAAGHREKAAEGYMSIVASTEEKLEGTIREFIFEQIVDCLYFTSQWTELKNFVGNEFTTTTNQRSTSPLMSFTTSQIDNIINMEKDNHQSLLELSDWDIFDQNKQLTNNFSCHKLLSLTENTLVDIAVNKKDNSKLRICKNVIHSGLQQSLQTKSREYLNNFIVLNYVINKIIESQGGNEELDSFNFIGNKIYGSVTLTRVMRWINLLQQNNIPDNLNLQVIALARKEGNLKLCQQELENFFKRKKVTAFVDIINPTETNFEQICTSIIELDENVWTRNVLHAVSETGKCWFNNPERHGNAIQFVSACCISAMSKSAGKEKSEISERLARMLLTLSDWLPQGGDILENMDQKPIQKLLSQLPNIKAHSDEKASSIVPEIDLAVGKLIRSSTVEYPGLAKSWGALGNWFYRWGRKIVENRADAHADKAGLRLGDIDAIKKLLPKGTENEVEKIVRILNRHQVTADDEEIGGNDISSTELIENQLRDIEILKDVDSTTILSIIQIWKQAYKSVYGYYEMAADSYFKYLNLATSVEREVSRDENEDKEDCSIVTATLRLLRLVVKHAIGLQDVLEEGLATTPTRPWKVIIPQLFSRLNHHESYVRKRVSELLCRVAKDSPHLIIFPAVVGAIQEEKTDSIASPASISEEDERTTITPLTFCFNSLLDTLSTQAPETVKQVQMLVKELKRVTLLWDEFWLHSLAQLYSEYSELFNALESEVRKSTDENFELLAEKHRILMAYVAEDMEKLYKITSHPPETNYERNFQEKYSKIIESTIEGLRRPLNLEKPNESWQKLKQLYAIFQQKLQKSSQSSLKMADLSPVLANMKDTAISMPGVETGEDNPIYIKAVDNIVYILPTKTKPKKLAFFGSDGKRYTYLFKGLEDLHLDERIMQFLSIANSMMSKSHDCNGNATVYRAHHYSVIPLGPRSGLISWVDGVTPIFALYKKWQQREAANPKKDKQYTAMRPSEMFYNKLTPLLAEHNLKTSDDRKTWPLSVLRKVLEELSKETPRDLLAKEFWCHSNTAATWRKAVRTYSLSVAVMSVIGYVIGLGDRHLDNMLVNLSSGDIVHIDYNVCFEKGKTLRVPEKVPFRMTPNLEEALGITGIEGTFRLACEHVLKTLRKERETLLTLLEAFVYDPLVDWAMSDDGTTASTRTTKALHASADIAALGNSSTPSTSSLDGSCGIGNAIISASTSNPPTPDHHRRHSKKKFENEVMRNTLTSRFTEIKPEWTQYRNEVNEQLIQMTVYLDDLERQRHQMQEDEHQRDLLSRQLAMIQEVETLGTAMSSHPLNTLSQRYNAYRTALDEYNNTKDILIEKQKDYEAKYQSYSVIIHQVGVTKIRELQYELEELSQMPVENEFDLVKELLENSAQGNLYAQADQAHKELFLSFVQQSFVVKLALETLGQYLSVIQYCPSSNLRRHRFIYYADWIQRILENPSCCQDIVEEFNVMQSSESLVNVITERAIPYAFELNKVWMEMDFNLRKNCDLLNEQFLKEPEENIEIFPPVEPKPRRAFQDELLLTTCDLIEGYITFEESYAKTTREMLTPNVSSILDEHHIYLTQLIETTKATFSNTEIFSACTVHLDVLNTIFNAIQSLHDVDSNFQIQIIPKVIHLFMTEDANVLDTVDQLISLCDVTDFNDVVNQPIGKENTEKKIETLKNTYDKIKGNLKDEKCLALFEAVEQIFISNLNSLQTCINAVRSLPHDKSFDVLDHIVKLKSIAVSISDSYSFETFLQKFEIRKYQTISQLLSISKQMSTSLKENNLQLIYDNRIIGQPVKAFIADCLIDLILGLGSYTAASFEIKLLNTLTMNSVFNSINTKNIVLSMIEENLSKNVYPNEMYACVKTMCLNMNAAIKKRVLIETMKRSIFIQTEALHHFRLISSAHFWMNEKILLTQMAPAHILYKSVMIQEFQNLIQDLSLWHVSIQKIKEEIMSFTTTIEKRLKWAVGANPALLEIQQMFDETVKKQEVKYCEHMNISTLSLNYCSAIINYESFKINPIEIAENDEQFLCLLTQFEKLYIAYRTAANYITPVEEATVQLLDPEGAIDHFWINNITDLLDEMTDNIQQKIANLEKDLIATQDNLQMSAHKLRSLIDSELRMDVRYLLKLILKIDGSSQAIRHKQFQNDYKQFLVKISDLQLKVLSKDFTEEIVKEIQQLIKELLIELEDVYKELLNLISERSGLDGHEKRDRSEGKGNGSGMSKECRKGNQPEQKRNAYAVSVWRRIRMKLEGRDPDPNRRLTITEQVDWMIREAMNPDNLAVLYEGWTPWV